MSGATRGSQSFCQKTLWERWISGLSELGFQVVEEVGLLAKRVKEENSSSVILKGE